jgi:hypothetical protein
MKTTIMLLLASCIISFAQTTTDNYALDSAQQLLIAAKSGDVETVKLLLDKGADINAKDSDGMTALMYAASSGQTNMVEFLLNKGADINAKDSDDMTALMYAGLSGHTDTVKLLLDKGADINAKDKAGHTALGNAIENGNAAIVQLLQPVNAIVASGTNTDRFGYVTNEALLTPFTLTNSIGDVITNAILVKLTPNKFIYKTDAGAMGMLPLASLPEDLQEKFGYDPQTAQAADEAEQQKEALQRQYDQQQQELAAQQANVQAQSQPASRDISSSIRAFAEKEFPGDYTTQEFVIKEQTEAYNWLASTISADGVPQDVFLQIKAKAADDYPNDYVTQKFEINEQVKAYTDLH